MLDIYKYIPLMYKALAFTCYIHNIPSITLTPPRPGPAQYVATQVPVLTLNGVI